MKPMILPRGKSFTIGILTLRRRDKSPDARTILREFNQYTLTHARKDIPDDNRALEYSVFRRDPTNPLDNAASDTVRVIRPYEQRALDHNGQALRLIDVSDNTGTKQEFVGILGNYHLYRISPSVDFDNSRVYRLRAWGLSVRDALLPHDLTPNELVRMTIDLKKEIASKLCVKIQVFPWIMTLSAMVPAALGYHNTRETPSGLSLKFRVSH
jgi:hypothetical protein